MLVGIDDIEWLRYSHAYGDASNVPNLIRNLLSTDETVREAAYHELFTSICHQGTIYSATVHALPFLIEILEAQDSPDRPSIALLVASILAGRGFAEVHYSRKIVNPFTGRAVEPPKNLDEVIAKERRIGAAVRQRGIGAIPMLLPFLKSEDVEIRQSVAEALAEYPDLSAATIPILCDAIAAESDEETRDAIQRSLSELKRRAKHS